MVDRRIMALWAKLAREESDTGGYHPLLYHLLDVAAVAQAMWDGVLTSTARSQVAASLGLDDADARTWIGFLAGTHDLGKASPGFFGMDPDGARRLRNTGVQSGPPVAKIAHGTLSGRALTKLLVTFGIAAPAAVQFAVLVGGHHGRFPSAHDMNTLVLQSVGGPSTPWPKLRETVLHELAALLGLPSNCAPRGLDNAAAFWLAGLISVADWIGSNQEYFGLEAPDTLIAPEFDPGYLQRARSRAHTALRELGWQAQPTGGPVRSFADLFHFEPNETQCTVVALEPHLASPGIVIIEAPMGVGKTEAALWLADRWRQHLGQRGCYLALPTQATSDQMFTRFADFLEVRFPGESTNVQLLHGHASLSAEFEELRRKGYELFRPRDTDDGPTGIGAAEWFTYRKRGLLAPFGVGTVDQALLAALGTKHVFVRLFGLAHKTIIIDEVHAYDVYISSILDRLLEWLAALGSTVVLLSATLPDARRQALAEAYGRGIGCTHAVPDGPYPRITWLGSSGTATVAVPPGDSRTVALTWIDGALPQSSEKSFALGEQLHRALHPGGTAAVICNTVGRAQAVYSALKRYFPGTASDGQPVLDLLHARFPFDERQAREQRALLRFGKQGAMVELARGDKRSVVRPDCAVLVATQIIEQSLDIDFDLMVSDLAPADLLLQRSGRLWRHARRARPMTRPEIWVGRPPVDAKGLPQFDRGSQYVYFPHVLLRSWLALKDRDSLSIPADLEGLVEAVYGDASPEGLPAPLVAAWQGTLHQQQTQLRYEAHEAAHRTLYPPTVENIDLSKVQGELMEEDKPELHPARQAMTRLTDPTVQVVVLQEVDGSPRLPDGSEFDSNSEPNMRQAHALLRRSVTLGHIGVVHALFDTPPPAGWRKHPLLAHHRLLVMPEEGGAVVRKYSVHLDPELGVLIGKEGG